MEPQRRELNDVRDRFLVLHREVGTLATDVLKFDIGWSHVLWRRPLREFEERLDSLFTTFMNLDADLIAHAKPPETYITGVVYTPITFQMHFGVRDSVRGLLSDTNTAIGSLRNQADFRGSLMVSVVAIVIASVSALVDVLKSGSP